MVSLCFSGDMPKKLGMQVYHTDDVPGYHEDDEETVAFAHFNLYGKSRNLLPAK